MNRRQQNAMLMMESEHHAEMNELGKYRVRSQHDSTKWYDVNSTGRGLICNCPDHIFNHSDCKHIHIIKTRIMQGKFSKKFKIMNRDNLSYANVVIQAILEKRGLEKPKK